MRGSRVVVFAVLAVVGWKGVRAVGLKGEMRRGFEGESGRV